MNNYKLILTYDGTPYHGWQMQDNAITVQQCLSEAIERIFGEKCTIYGSSRTDKGVHALGFCCNFKTEKDRDLEKITYGLHAVLPETICVLECRKADENFNARFDAKGKEYTFAQFRGKIIVIDVWATWCSSCLAKMPDFIALRDRYAGHDDILFLTVSIDRSEARDSWLATIERRRMEGLLNLTPDCEFQSQFESDYHISGIPRYIVIDKEGCIVTAYAPPPGGGLDEVITKAYDR